LWEIEPSFEATPRNEGIEEFDIWIVNGLSSWIGAASSQMSQAGPT
jgi:hypothetical protein